jgi:hypothetical protein
MSSEVHHDGGRLRPQAVTHRHVVEHADGTVSAIAVRGVPALVCQLCESHYYEPEVTDVIVTLLTNAEVAPGRAVAIDYPAAHAA